MAKCRSCGTDIPDGAEYCEECKRKLNTAKDSESYLDSLLSAVMTEEPKPREIVFPKRETSSLVSVPEKKEETTDIATEKIQEADVPVQEEAPELPEPEEFFIPDVTAALEEQLDDSVANDWMNDFFGSQEEVLKEEVAEEAVSDDWMTELYGGEEEASANAADSDDWMAELYGGEETVEEEPVPVVAMPENEPEDEPPMEDTFGLFFNGTENLPDLKSYSIFDDVDERDVDRMLADDLGDASFWKEDSSEADEAEEEVPVSEVGDIEDLFGLLEDERGEDAPAELEMATAEVISAAEFESMPDTFSGIVDSSEEEVPVSDFGDFADLFGGDGEEPVAEAVPVSDFGDFADLFGGEGEEPVAEAVPVSDFGDFADLFDGGDVAFMDPAEVPEGDTGSDLFDTPKENEAAEGHSMDDFADLFSGFDGGDGMFEFGAEPEELEPESASEPEAVLPANAPEKRTEAEGSESVGKKNKKQKKEKNGTKRLIELYHKLFDDVKVDPSKIKKPPTPEEIEAKKKAKQEAKERSKEEKEALLAEKKEQEKQVKLEKQRVIKEAKAEKKARKLEEAKLLLEEMERTRINRAGASIVFIFFAMIAVLVIMGTSIFSYSLSIRNAKYEFDQDRYTHAYNEIYGLEIKDEDILLYDRIMTVMYVQKQLNSYYNYYGMGDNPKALDSLLKGLQRYEKYIELAVELDVDSDLDSVRKAILQEISSVFMLNEQQAMEIIQSDSQVEYSQRVYDAVEDLEVSEE